MAAQAQVVVRVVDQASQALGKISGSVGKLEGRTTGLKNAARKASDGVGSMVRGVGALAAVAGVAVGVDALKNAFFSTAQAAAEAQRSTRMFNFYMKELNLDAGRATEIVNRMTNEFGLMPNQVQEAVQVLVRQGASLDQVSKLLPAIAASASAAGADVGRAMETAARGIAMNRSELLEQAGIMANLGPVQQAYAKQIGVKVDALTEEQRITASINAVMRESQMELKAFRATVDPATQASNNMAAAQRGLSLAIGEFTLPLLVQFQQVATTVIRTLTEWVRSEHFKQIREQAGPHITALRDLIVTAWNLISQVFNAVVLPVLRAIAPLFEAMLNNVGGVLRAITALLRGDFSAAWTEIRGVLERTAQAVLQSLRNLQALLLPVLRNIVDALVRGIREAIEAATAWIVRAGRELLDSLIRGMRERVDAVVASASEIGGNIVNAFKRVLRIRSPSQVMLEIGRNITRSLVQGMEDYQTEHLAAFARRFYGSLEAALKAGFRDFQVLKVAFPDEMAEMHGRRVGENFAIAMISAMQQHMPGLLRIVQDTANRAIEVLTPRREFGVRMAPVGPLPLPPTRLDILDRPPQPIARAFGIQFREAADDVANFGLSVERATAIVDQIPAAVLDLPTITPVPGLPAMPIRWPEEFGFEPRETGAAVRDALAPTVEILTQEIRKIPAAITQVYRTVEMITDIPPPRVALEPLTAAPTPMAAPGALAADPVAAALGGMLGFLAGPVSRLTEILEALNPVAAIVTGFMEKLGPVIQEIMQPMVILGEILAMAITPVLQILSPILRMLAIVIGGIVLALAHAWNAIAELVRRITFGAVDLRVNVRGIEESMHRLIHGTDRTAESMERLSNSINLVAGYGFTGVALRPATVQVNVYGVLDPYRTVTEIRSYHGVQSGRARW